MIGTLLNAGVVVVAGVAGATIGRHLSAGVRETVMHGLGLGVLLLGAQDALQTRHLLIVLASMALGGAIGEVIGIDQWLGRIGQSIQKRAARFGGVRFGEGFVTASLVFCVGPLTILGAVQDGLTGDYHLLAVKSLLDAVAGLAFAASMGLGVAFAAVTILVYQGGLTLVASLASRVLTPPLVTEMTATGGLLILGIGFQLLEIKRVRVANLLPALVLAPVGVVLVGRWV